MDLQRFHKLSIPVQDVFEWRGYLEFIEAYFRNRNIEKPIIVEIGVHGGHQKRFYEELLGYEHIGIDIATKYSKPDILGDSKIPETVERLKQRLNGRPINLLFIDGDHSYAGVKGDYELYAPLVQNIIALHDIDYYQKTVNRFWNELIKAEQTRRDKLFMSFSAWHTNTYRIGIGLIVLKDQIK